MSRRTGRAAAGAARESWFFRNPWKARLLTLLASLLFLEGVARVGVATGLLPYQRYPTAKPKVWGIVDPVVGRWRFPNTTFREASQCYDVEYSTNAEGLRDRPRSRYSTAARRVVVLGDSYVEGMGVAWGDRVTEVLEQTSGIEHLNFGTAGFGTIQEWLLYESRALKYEHSDVILFVLPKNDFYDNSPQKAEGRHARMYHPLLRPTGTGYEVYYPVSLERAELDQRENLEIVKNAIDNGIYLANVLRGASRSVGFAWKDRHDTGSDYDNFTEPDIEVMFYAMERIKALAGDRPLYVVSIPTVRDLLFARSQGPNFEFVERMQAFAASHDGVEYLDLLPHFISHAKAHGNDFAAYSHPCERHWNVLGHRVAAEAVQRFVHGPPAGPASAEPG